jgi:hypothetical protein
LSCAEIEIGQGGGHDGDGVVGAVIDIQEQRARQGKFSFDRRCCGLLLHPSRRYKPVSARYASGLFRCSLRVDSGPFRQRCRAGKRSVSRRRNWRFGRVQQ